MTQEIDLLIQQINNNNLSYEYDKNEDILYINGGYRKAYITNQIILDNITFPKNLNTQIIISNVWYVFLGGNQNVTHANLKVKAFNLHIDSLEYLEENIDLSEVKDIWIGYEEIPPEKIRNKYINNKENHLHICVGNKAF